MTRFAWTTWLAIFAATIVFVIFPRPVCTYIVLSIWAVYIPVFVLGVAVPRLGYFCRSISRGNGGEKKIALTFDDGPDPLVTPRLLDLLAEQQVSAAFFCIGSKIAKNQALAARIVEEGHLIANHTYTHPWHVSLLSVARLVEEIQRTQSEIAAATGVQPRYFRSPGGTTGPNFPRALRDCGVKMVGWDVRSFDTILPASRTISRIVRRARAGSIVLLHDGGAEPGRLLEIVRVCIERLRRQGYSFERLDRLIEAQPIPQESSA